MHPFLITVLDTAPCLIPEFHLIKSITIASPRYWFQTLNLQKDASHMFTTLLKQKVIFVKRKTGFLSYNEDPKGFRSILSRSFPKPNQFIERKQKNKHEFIRSFSADPNVLAFAHHFCNDLNMDGDGQMELEVFSTTALYDCLTHEKPEILQTFLTIYHLLHHLPRLNSNVIWNLRILWTFYGSFFAKLKDPLLPLSLLEAVRTKIEMFFDNDLQLSTTFSGLLADYVQQGKLPKLFTSHHDESLFGCYLNLMDIPTPLQLNSIMAALVDTKGEEETLLQLVNLLRGKVPVCTILKMYTAMMSRTK